jgi:hypothetical protein
MSDDTMIMPATVNLPTNPEVATTEAKEAGVQLLKLLDNKPKKVVINGKRHIEFEDWVTLGNFYGVTVKTGEPEPVEIFGAKGFQASAEVLRVDDGIVIGGASAYCLDNERNWKGKDYFQMASMAQTRAGSKALSNVLRWVVALSGLAGTPAEEMEGVNHTRPKRTRPKKTRSNMENVVDAEITERKGKTPTGKPVKSDEPVVHDMVPPYERVQGISKELDQYLESITAKKTITVEKIVMKAQNLLGTGSITKEQLKEIKTRFGIIN